MFMWTWLSANIWWFGASRRWGRYSTTEIFVALEGWKSKSGRT